MQIWMFVLGAAAVLLAIYDAITTTLMASTAAGPLTGRVGGGLWWLAKRTSSGPQSTVLTSAGSTILVATILAWMSLLWIGWWLIFAADASAVVETSSGEPASGWDRVYYTAYTLFTLGVGDFRPASTALQVATSLAVMNGLLIATLAITYVIPVMTAVTERRQQAAAISGFGTSAQEILVNAWDDGSLRFLDGPLVRFAEDINRTGQRHLTYPILHFFHSADRSDEFAVSIAALDEAVTIATLAVDEDVRPHPAALGSVRAAIDRLLGIIMASFDEAAQEPPPPPDLAPLRAVGIPVVDDDAFRQRLEAERDRRRALLGFETGSTWPWEEAVDVADA